MKERSCPLSAKKVVETYFIDNRARVLEIAAFLDRIDRALDPESGRKDFRYQALLGALRLLVERTEERGKALQVHFSDHSAEPRESAMGLKGAYGAWEGADHEDH